ncbi:MAG: hypothetical protein NT130_04555 [Candidatus Micrarchaeota archaeon]|nr:hypothetical protein [Candidatus Micrarchaeota archaeon]
MQHLFSYVIDHVGNINSCDPRIEKGVLTLGKGGCKPKIRKKAVAGDWIIATLGKKFPRIKYEPAFAQKYKEDYAEYLVYAMKVTDKKGEILYSSYYYVFNSLIKLPKRFRILIKTQQGHKKFPHQQDEEAEIKLVENFINWLKSHKRERPYLFESQGRKKFVNSCLRC